MPKYFDPITQENLDIDPSEGTILYLVKVGDSYSIKGLSSGIDRVPNDPHTHATHYWLIEDVAKFLDKVNKSNLTSDIFPDGILTSHPLSISTIRLCVEFDPRTKDHTVFNPAIGEQLRQEWGRDRRNRSRNNIGIEAMTYEQLMPIFSHLIAQLQSALLRSRREAMAMLAGAVMATTPALLRIPALVSLQQRQRFFPTPTASRIRTNEDENQQTMQSQDSLLQLLSVSTLTDADLMALDGSTGASLLERPAAALQLIHEANIPLTDLIALDGSTRASLLDDPTTAMGRSGPRY